MLESPWWLSFKGRDGCALAALNGLGYTGEHGRMKLAQIQTTLEEMKKDTEGVTYMECFRKSNLRRTLLTIAPFWIHTFTGISFVAGYFTVSGSVFTLLVTWTNQCPYSSTTFFSLLATPPR
jgi:hypothetical protein